MSRLDDIANHVERSRDRQQPVVLSVSDCDFLLTIARAAEALTATAFEQTGGVTWVGAREIATLRAAIERSESGA